MLLSIVMIKTNAQTGLNFQGVARTSNNVILASQAITIKLSILQGSSTATAEYTEIKKVTTNAQGLFTAVIGDTGAISTLGNFTNINWKLTPKFLKIEMDPAAGNNFITMGTTQFQYVAYAQFAKSVDAENIIGIVPVTLGGTGVNSLTGLKTALALNNVNNTTDLTKPISSLSQTALDLKLDAADTSKYTKQTYSDSALLAKQVLISLKLNAVDTSKYTKQTYSDSAFLSKIKISDTAAMLSGRIAKDTLGLSNRINLKVNTTDLITSLALKENISNKSTAVDLGGISPSNVLFPTQKAVKDYVAANNAGGGVADGGITTIKLADGAVTDAKVATGISKSKVGLGNVENTTISTWVGTNNITTLGTITTGIWSGTTIAIANGGTGVATTTANSFFAGPNGSTGAPGFRTLVASDLPTISTSYIQNTPDATQTGSIDISGNAKIGTALNVNGIYIGIGKNNQAATNTAIGNTALQGINDGSNNTAIGNYTMKDNNSGFNNTSVGANSLQNLNTGNDNTALGYYAMLNSTIGNFNTATGSLALSSNTGLGNRGSYNVANGYKALLFNQTGSNNIGIGYYSLFSNRTGSNNTAIGNQADVASGDLTNATAIGNGAIVSASNTIQVGNSSVTSVYTSGAITAPSFNGTLNGNATTVTITNSGKLIVGASSAATPSAVLEASSTTQGFLPPRMTKAQRDIISSPTAGLMIWCSNNFGGEIEVYNGSVWVNMNGFSNSTLSIGNYYQGGQIAYILVSGDPGYDANVQHGLIAATIDQISGMKWYNLSYTTTGATGTALGTGLSNTNTIITSQGARSNSYAAGFARSYTGGGYTDWYLPSKDELAKLYAMKLLGFGGFTGNFYWSSSEVDAVYAWYQDFNNGVQDKPGKGDVLSIRAIRAF